jgi:hypothetical protein
MLPRTREARMRRDKRAVGLAATSEALTSWRRQFGGRGRRIPEGLWAEAAEVARSAGVVETARALRLDAKRLAALVEPLAARAEREPATFVELGGVEVVPVPEPVVVEFIGREGDQIRVRVSRGGGSGVDLAELARAFWSRSR